MSAEAKALLEQNRNDNGRFGHQLHSEDPTVTISTDGPVWPGTLPEPVIEMHLGDTGLVTTEITVGGEMFSSTYSRWDDKDDIETDMYVLSFDHSNEDSGQAEEWAVAQHKKITAELREVTERAFDTAKHAAVARATGKPAELTVSGLHEFARASEDIAQQATRDAALANTSIIARGILEAHPEAAYMSVDFSDTDRAPFVGVLDRNRLHIVTHYPDEAETLPWVGRIRKLRTADAEIFDELDEDQGLRDEKIIPLGSAAGWTPGQ